MLGALSFHFLWLPVYIEKLLFGASCKKRERNGWHSMAQICSLDHCTFQRRQMLVHVHKDAAYFLMLRVYFLFCLQIMPIRKSSDSLKTEKPMKIFHSGKRELYERISLKFTDQRHIEFLHTQFSVQNELQCFFRRFLFLATLLKILSKSREREKKTIVLPNSNFETKHTGTW